MVYKYRYRTGHGFRGVDAETVGNAVEGMMVARGGRLAPADVVEESEPEEAPLHQCFTWDDTEAARKCREDEARRVISSYVVVRTDDAGREQEEIANVSVQRPYDKEGAGYMSARAAMQDPKLRARILEMAKSVLDGWQARYGHLSELAEAAAFVGRAREAASARKPAARRERRRAAPHRQPAAATT